MNIPEAIAKHYRLTERDSENVARLIDSEERFLEPTDVVENGVQQALPVHYIPGDADDVIVQFGGFGWTPGGREKNQDSAFRGGIVDALQSKDGARPTIISIGYVGVEQAGLDKDYAERGYFNHLTHTQSAALVHGDFGPVGKATASALSTRLNSAGHQRARLTITAPSQAAAVAAEMISPLIDSQHELNVALIDPVVTPQRKLGKLALGMLRAKDRHAAYLALNGETYQRYAENTVATSIPEWIRNIIPQAKTHLAYVRGLGGKGIVEVFTDELMQKMADSGSRIAIYRAGASEYDTEVGAELLAQRLRQFGEGVLRACTTITDASHAITSTQRIVVDSYELFQQAA